MLEDQHVLQDDHAADQRRQFDLTTADLIGRQIQEVAYWDLHNYGPEPAAWDYGDWHHAVMGVELTTDRGPSCVLWTDTFYPYGVEVFHEPISQHVGGGEQGPQSWRVDDHDFWRVRAGQPILAATTFWEHIEVGPGRRVSDNVIVSPPRTYTVPIAVRLDFSVGPVWMISAMPNGPEGRTAFVPADEIMVVLSADRMRTIGFPDTDFLGPTHLGP
jgi:hypothetical protein